MPVGLPSRLRHLRGKQFADPFRLTVALALVGFFVGPVTPKVLAAIGARVPPSLKGSVVSLLVGLGALFLRRFPCGNSSSLLRPRRARIRRPDRELGRTAPVRSRRRPRRVVPLAGGHDRRQWAHDRRVARGAEEPQEGGLSCRRGGGPSARRPRRSKKQRIIVLVR